MPKWGKVKALDFKTVSARSFRMPGGVFLQKRGNSYTIPQSGDSCYVVGPVVPAA
jgi:hypothetical protein